VVTASLLSGLQVTTTDSTANADRVLTPAFSAGVLHYAIGCTDNDTMTVTPSAASGVRLAVDGVQVASGGSRSVTVGRESDVHISLTGADGAITTYVVGPARRAARRTVALSVAIAAGSAYPRGSS